jgi:Tfp pilus assembly protein PilF
VAERAFQELGAKYVAEVSAAVMEGDLRRACDTANSAIANGIGHPVIFNARGLWLQQQGENAAALEAFQNALQLGGPNGVLLNAIGMCHLNLDQIPEARAAFERSAALEPATALTHYRIGLALAMGGDHQGARAKYKRVLELDPNHVEALSSLASIAAREGDGEAARSLAERALALEPRQPTARVALAQLDVSEKNFGSAETRLKHLLADGTLTADARPAVLGLLGDSLDGQKQYADAFAAYSQENHELRQLNRRRFAGNQGADAARNLVGYFERERAERWRAPDDGGHFADAPAQHVFLLGFMRSGTTLLEQVLASNPQITALEEKGLLNGLGAQFLTGPEPLESLAKISANEAMELRRHYWHRVRQFLPDIGGKVFVDKQPLNTTKLPIIAKLFPRAKILFALRDPRDVVFSCFRRHFKVNVTMYEFLSLEDSARFYSSIMRLEEVLRPLLGLDLLEHRYEAMVEDFEGRVRAVCDFIGVEWNDTMRTFNKSAPVMDLRSPSAIQVRKPLYGEGVGQWRRYHAQLQPIFPILKPWVEKFGYPLE